LFEVLLFCGSLVCQFDLFFLPTKDIVTIILILIATLYIVCRPLSLRVTLCLEERSLRVQDLLLVTPARRVAVMR